MTNILIVDSDDGVVRARRDTGGMPYSGTNYAQALTGITPDLTTRIITPYVEPIPGDALEGVDAVVFTGSGVAWSVDAPEGAVLRDLMTRVFDAELPVMASCNGMQLGAVMLGGSIRKSPNGFEGGLARDVTLTEAGRFHPMMAGRAPSFNVICVHADEVDRLPLGAVLQAGNAHSEVQAFTYEIGGIDLWAVEYHPEYTTGLVAWILSGDPGADPAFCEDLANAAQDPAAAARIGVTQTEMQDDVHRTELRNWLTHIGATT